MSATVVDTSTLLKVIGASLGAGIGVSAIFALAVLGATRSSDMRRQHRTTVAGAYAILAVVGVLATIAAVTYGVVLTTEKA